MKIIEVPIFNEDGSIQVTHLIGPEESLKLLQFAINFLAANGLAIEYAVHNNQQELPFDD